MTVRPCQVLIAGGGPAGLAAALMLIERGWRDIVLIERRVSPDHFERGKAFNYQLDGRGQTILERVGIDAATLRQFGLPNDRFKQVVFNPDGSYRENVFPALLPGRKTPYWMTRARMLEMLQAHLHKTNHDDLVSVHYGVTVSGLMQGEQGLLVQVQHSDGEAVHYQPRLVLACDGLSSSVRSSLDSLPGVASGTFDMRVHPSPSAQLGYKVLSFPSAFAVKGSNRKVDDHTLAYCFLSRHKETGRRMALFALPVPHADEPRNINIILHRSHHMWTLDGVNDVTEWLQDSFPQLDLDQLVDKEELEEFAALKTSYFPDPQYAAAIHHAVDNAGQSCDVLLLGDAARAFPPDLGMGVNAALEDVSLLAEQLDANKEDSRRACTAFASRRLPENRALVRLVQRVHPYQYNQVPWRLKLWLIKFLCQRSLNRLSRGVIPEPPFVLVQKHTLDFVEIDRRAQRADRAFQFCLLAFPALLLWLILN